MTDCIRKGEFEVEEKHKCFIIDCDGYCQPKYAQTCPECNFKFCENHHCGCDLSHESRYAIEILYKTYCELCSNKKSVVLWKLNGVEVEHKPDKTPKLGWNVLTLLEALVDGAKTSLHMQLKKDSPDFNQPFKRLNKSLTILRKEIELGKKRSPQTLLKTCEFRETKRTRCNKYPTRFIDNRYLCDKHFEGVE